MTHFISYGFLTCIWITWNKKCYELDDAISKMQDLLMIWIEVLSLSRAHAHAHAHTHTHTHTSIHNVWVPSPLETKLKEYIWLPAGEDCYPQVRVLLGAEGAEEVVDRD
jgi:hypothetical protein